MNMAERVNGCVLITGAAGHIGSSIARALLDEPVDQLVLLDNFTKGRREDIVDVVRDPRVQCVSGDIKDSGLLHRLFEDVDYVFHLAALWIRQCQDFPCAGFEVNIRGTFNVLEAAAAQGVRRLVFASSSSVYGTPVETPITEEHPYNHRTFYGASKVAGEHLCRAFNEKYGLDYVGLRYMNVYGPGQSFTGTYTAVISKMLQRIEQGQPLIIYGTGLQSRDFTYIDDAVDASILALKHGESTAIYNVCTGSEVTVKELADLLLELTGSDVGTVHETEAEAFLIRKVGSTEKAERGLGFKAQVPLREGLQRLLQWRSKQRVEVPHESSDN